MREDTHGAHQTPRLVVGVGASAGGLTVFRQLLAALPAQSRMAFVLVQHLDPTHKSRLAELLSASTPMAVVEVTRTMPIEPNTVYVIAPGTVLGVSGGRLQPSESTVGNGVRLPVDDLFRGLAREYGPRGAAIILSGDGSDGSAGARDITAAGGLVIAQEPTGTEHADMPHAAIASGVVELVLCIEAMPLALDRFAALPPRARLDPTVPADVDDDSDEPNPTQTTLGTGELERLAGLLQTQLDFDVRAYKTGTVQRRLLRRMMLSGFERIDAYLDHLEDAPAEQRLLQRDLLISVTEFFRDTEAFEVLRTTVVDPLVERTSHDGELRVWVPGCATGEEAYSIAITFLDSMRAHAKRCALHVFATDIDPFALTVARSGHYPHSAEQLSDDCLARYFRPRDDCGHQVLPALRDHVLFSGHDLTKDPPFSRMDLVSCRNVLIYLNPHAQQDVLARLHFSLQPEGNLFMGRSESTGSGGPRFATVSQSCRIYQKVGKSRPLSAPRFRLRVASLGHAGRPPAARPGRVERGTEDDLARQAVLAAWVAPSVVVSAAGPVVFMHGDLSPYLRFPQGNVGRLDLPAILRPELATRTLAAVYKCRRNTETVVALSSPDGAHGARVRITAKPAPALGDDAVILTFERLDDREIVPPPSTADTPQQEAVIGQLDEELQATREDLRNMTKELERSIEELRSSSEESLSMNEELQAANEELEASAEELRSLNEELSTVNAQLRDKIALVEQTHDDLQNFFASSRVATMFLDDRLRVKRFTPAAAEILQIDDRDVGRFVGDIACELLQHDLEREATKGLRTLSRQTREINTREGGWVARQILPYRTQKGRIDGVVVTFTDITDVKTVAERLALRQRQQAVIARTGLLALRDAELQQFMDQAVRDIQQTLDTDSCSILELQPGGQRLLLRAGVGSHQRASRAAFVSTGPDSEAGYTLQSGEPMIVEDRATDTRLAGPPPPAEAASVSGVTCAIRIGDHDYGTLSVHTTTHRVFSPEDTTFLQAMAVMIGSAIERIQSRLRMALGRDVAQALAQPGTTDAALVRVLECFSTLLPIAVAEVWWRAKDGNSLARGVLHVASADEHGEVENAFGRTRFDAGDGVVGRVFLGGRATWYTDLGDSAGFFRRDSTVALGLVSAFVLPVQSGTDVLGVITLFSRERLVADEALLRSLETVGRTVGDFVARQQVEHRMRLLAAITESSHDAIVTYGHDGIVTRWLSGAEHLFGYATTEMLGQSIERIVPVESRDELWEVYARIRQGEVIEPFETVRQRKDGQRVEVSVRSAPVRDLDGVVVAVSSTERDVTRLKLTERRLVAADQQKNEFLAMLGHELRNPLAAIRSAADLLKYSVGVDPSLIRTQAILERQSAHMSKLLDGLLDVARMIRGKITLQREVIDLCDVCREVLSDAAPRVSDRRIILSVDLPREPVWVDGDRVRLVQIFDNLLSNAVKYSDDDGSVSLAMSTTADVAKLTIRNTGSGIDADSMPHIFEVFHQSDRSLDRAQGGLGLGLALVKALSELHGGSVAATSGGKDRGAEFVLVLPVTAKRPAPFVRPSQDNDGPLRILLIEDNDESAEMMCLLLEREGHEVRVATRGDDGVSMARASPPDVILCDIGLPQGVSGLDVARQLRRDATTRRIPMVALTGYGAPQDKQASRDAGFDVHLTKPVDPQTLQRVLATIERARPRTL